MDLSRHISVFNPESVVDDIHIIGVGATGSFVAMQLARMGVQKITIYDFDTVEVHNIPNQMFDKRHLGQYKVDALESMLKDINPDITIVKNYGRVVASDIAEMSGYLFLLVDSMTARKELFLEAKKNRKLLHYWESRLGSDQARVYCLPIEEGFNYSKYEGDFYSDDVAEVSACGTSITVLPIVIATASLMISQFIAIIMRDDSVTIRHYSLFDNMYNIYYETYDNVVTGPSLALEAEVLI
jgi:molybdopterin/thiamine biosynthesis adenylyltransferase